jgi:hypothetical protein
MTVFRNSCIWKAIKCGSNVETCNGSRAPRDRYDWAAQASRVVSCARGTVRLTSKIVVAREHPRIFYIDGVPMKELSGDLLSYWLTQRVLSSVQLYHSRAEQSCDQWRYWETSSEQNGAEVHKDLRVVLAPHIDNLSVV